MYIDEDADMIETGISAEKEMSKKLSEMSLEELWKEYEFNRDGYTNAKTDFIQKYTEQAKAVYQGRY